jgi:hypothetical protein
VVAGNVGTIEVGSQVMSSSYALSLFLVLLALEAPRIEARLLFPIVLILSFSTNISFIAAPLFFIQGSTNRDRCLKLCGVLTLIPILINGLLATFYSSSPVSVSQFSGRLFDFFYLLQSLFDVLDRTIFYLFITPVAGGLLFPLAVWARIPIIFLSFGIYRSLWKRNCLRMRLLSAGLISGSVLYIAAHSIGRGCSVSGSIHDFSLSPNRFSFLLVTLNFLAWSVLIINQPTGSSRTKNMSIFAMVLVQLATTVLANTPIPHTPVGTWKVFSEQISLARKSPPGTLIDDVQLGPYFGSNPWGLIHCDTTNKLYLICSELRGNLDGRSYEIPRSGA